MGVWERSPAGLEIARADPGLDAGNRAALPDLRDGDVIGSPYCVRDYVVDDRFGGRAALAAARAALHARGLGLILDYVPNHVAPDHPWTTSRPECFVTGSDDDLRDHPEAFLRTPAGVLARGRDPYFPPWPDVVQLDAFSPALRDAVAATLIDIGGQCDGLRCDMAMLMANEVFARTWGDRAGPAPAEEYWPGLIARAKAACPDLLFLAEAYWDMEWTLQQQGFDLCYDKRLYDRLVHEPAESVHGHLEADAGYQERLLRFIENHDEPRAAATFGPAQARAAAVATMTLQGARLVHDGQMEGRRTRIPVFLARGPDEPVDEDLRAFYHRLLRAVADSDLAHRRVAVVRVRGLAGQRLAPPPRRVVLGLRRGAAEAPPRRRQPLRHARAGARSPAVGRPRGPGVEADRPPRRRPVRPRRRPDGGRRSVRRARRLGVALPRVRARRLNAGQRLTAGRCRTAGGGGAARPRRAPAPPPRAATACGPPSRSASR